MLASFKAFTVAYTIHPIMVKNSLGLEIKLTKMEEETVQMHTKNQASCITVQELYTKSTVMVSRVRR